MHTEIGTSENLPFWNNMNFWVSSFAVATSSTNHPPVTLDQSTRNQQVQHVVALTTDLQANLHPIQLCTLEELRGGKNVHQIASVKMAEFGKRPLKRGVGVQLQLRLPVRQI